MRRLGILFGLVCAMAVGARAADREVTVFAASSLTNAMQDIGRGFEAGGGAKVKFSFAASSLLARQIEAGAQADAFFAADTEWMNYLGERNLIQTATRKDILSNRLVLVANKDSVIRLKIAPGFALAQALGEGRLAVADPDSVPAGRYARSALTALGVWDSVAARLVRAENVRVALTYVARGEAPLGIVYETDAKSETQVKVVDVFPANSHLPIVYPAALTTHGTSAEAKAFLDYSKSAPAADVFKKYGFSVLP
ncbi:MAG: molybdate ABC transporter substrate-binding protein [Alphaproteobacteria bacterium]|nr:molybdate ABC transporter substrate-binding protein [Alphaproteobacteria bacterium]